VSPYKLFELVRGAVEERVGRVGRVKLYRIHIDPSTLELLIEYIVEFEHRELSVKKIYYKLWLVSQVCGVEHVV